MPVVTVKAKQHPARTPEKVDALMTELRQVVARHFELPEAKVMVVYEEATAGVWWQGESLRPGGAGSAGGPLGGESARPVPPKK